jgi:hypothetical protein
MNQKTCPFCGSHECIRKGLQDGHQRWQCKRCSKKFQANKKASPNIEELFCLYVFNKQTLNELKDEYGIRTKDLQKKFDEIVLPTKVHNPRSLALSVDTTFFGEFGVTVFRDYKEKEDLWYTFCENENLFHYAQGRRYLERLGYFFTSVTCDGLPGLPSVFNDIPFQYCHFHAKKNITKYLTRRPKTEAGILLHLLMSNIHLYTEESFKRELIDWETRFQDFLKEKTIHPNGSWSYTHRRLKSALRSMKHMLPYLFTYQKFPHLKIPKTTNTLEGHFRHLKTRVKVHPGLSTKRKQKLIETVLLNSSAQYFPDTAKKLFRS